MSGWIKIHRDLANHWVAQDMEKLGRWLDLLMFASHKDNKVLMGGRLVDVKRGQMIASCDFLAKRWKCSKSTVSSFLDLLESDSMIERCTERKTTRLTICNYESYQQSEKDAPNDVVNDNRTIAERCPNELKNVEECKEINNTTTAHAREEGIDWDDAKEDGYFERFKAQGKARDAMRMTGKSLAEVMSILDAYRAKRKLQNRGHADFNQFCNLFTWYLEQGKFPQIQSQPQSKVISGQAIFDMIR